MIDALSCNLRHLDAIRAIGACGSISAASARVNLSQPALTQAVGKVEALLGQSLFERQSDGARPNAAGVMMIERIERAIAHLVEGGRLVRRAARLSPIPYLERRVTLGQLRAVIAVEQAGSFVLAAQRIGFAQPTLHRAARELEQLLGVSLLERAGRTVRATPAALRLVRHARLAVAELQAGIDELAAMASAGAGRISVGSMPLARALLLPQTLARFCAANPAASVSVQEGTYAEMLARLRDGSLDLLVGAMRDPAPTADIVQEGMFDDDPVIVGRADHPLSRERGFAVHRLRDFPWVIAAHGAPVRRRWETMFAVNDVTPPRPPIECGSLMVCRGLLLEGDWLTLMSRDQFRIERAAGLLAEFGDVEPALRRRIGITIRRDWRPTSLQAAFVAELRRQCLARTS